MSNASAERRRIWTEQQIARAEKFVACMFIGGLVRYDKRDAATLEEARAVRTQMEEEYKNDPHKRPIMIYAVTRGDNLSIHVE